MANSDPTVPLSHLLISPSLHGLAAIQNPVLALGLPQPHRMFRICANGLGHRARSLPPTATLDTHHAACSCRSPWDLSDASPEALPPARPAGCVERGRAFSSGRHRRPRRPARRDRLTPRLSQMSQMSRRAWRKCPRVTARVLAVTKDDGRWHAGGCDRACLRCQGAAAAKTLYSIRDSGRPRPAVHGPTRIRLPVRTSSPSTLTTTSYVSEAPTRLARAS